MSAIFISHSSRDDEVAAELSSLLKEQGYQSVFLDFDPADGIPAGRNWEQELYAQLRGCQAVVVLCSEHSMASQWCFAEITHARSLGKHVIPLKASPCNIHSVLSDIQIIDLTTKREEGLERLWRGLKEAGLDPADTFAWDRSRPPYPGLMAFQEEDAAVFFGRDAEIQLGLDTLKSFSRFGGARMLLVLGPSGSGKSSLVRAGLVPRLRRNRDEWLVVAPFRPLDRPMQELAIVLAEAFSEHGQERNWRDIWHELQVASAEKIAVGNALNNLALDLQIATGKREATVLLVIDQAEELLGYAQSTDAQVFLSLLAAALQEPNSPIMAICTLRSDFLGDFQEDLATRDLMIDDLKVGPLTVEKLYQVIEGPAGVAGIQIESGLTKAMVDDTETEDALPLLAFTLRELYERYGDDNLLNINDYRERLGGLEGSVARVANSVIAANPLSVDEELDLRKAFISMVRINEEGQYYRRATRWNDMPESVRDLLERFVQARLLVSRGEGRERILEVAHEALFRSWDKMSGWLDEDREFLLWRKRLTAAYQGWEQTGRKDKSALLSGRALEEGRGWLEQRGDQLDTEESDYIRDSVLLADTRRRRRVISFWLAAIFLIVVAVGGLTLWRLAESQRVRADQAAEIAKKQRQAAEQQSQIARARYLSAAAVRTLKDDPELSILLALEAVNAAGSEDSPLIGEIEEALHQAIQASRVRMTFSGHGDAVAEVFFDLNRNVLITGSTSGMVRTWDSKTGHQLEEFSWKADSISKLAISRQRDRAVTTSGGAIAQVWELSTGQILAQITGHKDHISSVAISNDGRYVVTGSGDKTTKVWAIESNKEVVQLVGHTTGISSVAISANGKLVITGSYDGTAKVWAAETGEELASISAPGRNNSVSAVTFSRDGKLVFTGHRDDKARVWDWEKQRLLVELIGHGEDPVSADFSSDGRKLVTGSYDRTARVWDVETGTELIRLAGHTGAVLSVAFSVDGERVVTGSSDQTARIWYLGMVKELARLSGGEDFISSVAFSRNGERLVTGGRSTAGATARVWNVGTWDELAKLVGSQERQSVSSVAISPDGKRVVTDGVSTPVVWDVDTEEQLVRLSGHSSSVSSVAISPDGKRVATSSFDNTVRIWDLSTGRELNRFTGHTYYVSKVLFSGDGKRVISGSHDRTVRVWDVETGRELTKLSDVGCPISLFMAVSRDNRYMITCGEESATPRIWNMEVGKELVKLSGHTNQVNWAAFSPDGTRVVSTSRDKTARVWDAMGGQELFRLSGYDDVAFSPDGKLLAAVQRDWSVQIYAFRLDELVLLARNRVTRPMTTAECQKYLSVEQCPAGPAQ